MSPSTSHSKEAAGSSGKHTLLSLRKAVRSETGVLINRSYLEKMLKNRFYLGFFRWQGIEYKGHHDPLIRPLTKQKGYIVSLEDS